MSEKSDICGFERIGETGIRWVCIAPPHGAENAPLLEHLVERIATGMLYPRSHQHHFISETEAARRGIATPNEQMYDGIQDSLKIGDDSDRHPH